MSREKDNVRERNGCSIRTFTIPSRMGVSLGAQSSSSRFSH